jgi:opacity protein-like surface antigen
MKRLIVAALAVFALNSAAAAASVTNRDGETVTLRVTEGADQVDLPIGPGETVEFCAGGCFVTFSGGQREVLTGAETIEIVGGAPNIK